MNNFWHTVPLLLFPALVALPLAASEPLYVKNLSPVTGLLGLPSQRSADSEDAGKLGVALHSSVSNSYLQDSNSREYLNLDGETQRFALELRYGLAEAWDVQLEVPWVDQSGGNLDDLINDWHDLWGMSDGGRSEAPNDLLDYRYQSRYENRSGSFGLQTTSKNLPLGKTVFGRSGLNLLISFRDLTAKHTVTQQL